MNPLEILQKTFGYPAFRLHQEAVIASVLQNRDTFVLMPTGGGKSLCYQIPALLLDGVAIVISPLIALMKDQVDALRANGVAAACINSTLPVDEHETILAKARSGALKLLYLAPERLLGNNAELLTVISSWRISLIAVDEAHCISHWGHDFRPEYLMLAKLRRALPHVPMIALTATADAQTQKDIIGKLELKKPAVFVSSFNRQNIRYCVDSKDEGIDKLLNFLSGRDAESGIIYCLSRRSTEALAEQLTGAGHAALPYHAGLDRSQRARHQELFLKDEIRIIVATIAFGMGIDKPNVRFVVHMDLPKTIESYYQETGRAGRDGQPAEALLFYSPSDVQKLRKFARIENNPTQTDIALKKLSQMDRFARLTTCRRQYLLNYFNESSADYCGNCDVCLASEPSADPYVNAKRIFAVIRNLGLHAGPVDVIDALERAHKTVPGAEGRDRWNRWICSLIEQKYLARSKYCSSLVLTESASDILNGPANGTSVLAPDAASPGPQVEPGLKLRLKQLRMRLALKENIPAYMVFTDKALAALSAYLPLDTTSLACIPGIGPSRIRRYGNAIVDVIGEFCDSHGLETRAHLLNGQKSRAASLRTLTLRMFRNGLTIREIAGMRRLAPAAIHRHLEFYARQGDAIVTDIVSTETTSSIRELAEQYNAGTAGSTRRKLNERYSNQEIRYVIASLDRVSEPEMIMLAA